MQAPHGGVAGRRAAAAQPELVEPVAAADDDAKRAGRDFRVERPLVGGVHPVELAGAVGDQAGEDVEPAARALGIRDARDSLAQRQRFHQRDDVDAALLEHGAVFQVDFVHAQRFDPVGHADSFAGKKARPHAVRHVPQSKVQARRLDLILGHRLEGLNVAVADHGADRLGGNDPGGVGAARGPTRLRPGGGLRPFRRLQLAKEIESAFGLGIVHGALAGPEGCDPPRPGGVPRADRV